MKTIITLAILQIGCILGNPSTAPQFNWKPDIGFIGSPSDAKLNWRPIIGVLTQPIDEGMRKVQPKLKNKTSYIMASYINALSSAGARTVPLIFDNPNVQDEIQKVDALNGVFYCGGDGGDAYLEFGRKIYNKVKEINDKGGYLPAWGTCLGFQYLNVYAASTGLKVLTEGTFDSDDDNYVLHYLVNATDTRMFGPLGPLAQTLAEKNLTYNHHHSAVTPDKYESDAGLKAMFQPTSLSYDNKGQVFVASMEAYNYPFFATQFHPEKQQFVYYPTVKIDHDNESIEYNRYFADFFVHQCRHNFNSFGSYLNEVKEQIENVGELVMMPTYTGLIYAF